MGGAACVFVCVCVCVRVGGGGGGYTQACVGCIGWSFCIEPPSYHSEACLQPLYGYFFHSH